MTADAERLRAAVPETPETPDALRQRAYTAAFADSDPDPTPAEHAEAARLILGAIAADGREVVPWLRIRRQLPEHLRQYDNRVLTAMWLAGTVWIISNRGRWYVAAGDQHDQQRAARDHLAGTVSVSRAI
jgi:hypothetical protein